MILMLTKKDHFILKQLFLNKNIGLVCDAGTPLISDPGYKIVQECYLKNVNVTHLPGPSAVINALVSQVFQQTNSILEVFYLQKKVVERNNF